MVFSMRLSARDSAFAYPIDILIRLVPPHSRWRSSADNILISHDIILLLFANARRTAVAKLPIRDARRRRNSRKFRSRTQHHSSS